MNPEGTASPRRDFERSESNQDEESHPSSPGASSVQDLSRPPIPVNNPEASFWLPPFGWETGEEPAEIIVAPRSVSIKVMLAALECLGRTVRLCSMEASEAERIMNYAKTVKAGLLFLQTCRDSESEPSEGGAASQPEVQQQETAPTVSTSLSAAGYVNRDSGNVNIKIYNVLQSLKRMEREVNASRIPFSRREGNISNGSPSTSPNSSPNRSPNRNPNRSTEGPQREPQPGSHRANESRDYAQTDRRGGFLMPEIVIFDTQNMTYKYIMTHLREMTKEEPLFVKVVQAHCGKRRAYARLTPRALRNLEAVHPSLITFGQLTCSYCRYVYVLRCSKCFKFGHKAFICPCDENELYFIRLLQVLRKCSNCFLDAVRKRGKQPFEISQLETNEIAAEIDHKTFDMSCPTFTALRILNSQFYKY